MQGLRRAVAWAQTRSPVEMIRSTRSLTSVTAVAMSSGSSGTTARSTLKPSSDRRCARASPLSSTRAPAVTPSLMVRTSADARHPAARLQNERGLLPPGAEREPRSSSGRCHSPDLPPDFSSSRTSRMYAPRSTPLTMS